MKTLERQQSDRYWEIISLKAEIQKLEAEYMIEQAKLDLVINTPEGEI